MKRRASPWILVVALATGGCATKPAVLRPTPQQLAEAERAKAVALQQAELAATERRKREQRRQAAAEFANLQARFQSVLTALQRWDAAGDERIEPIGGVLAVAGELASLEPLQQACGLRLHVLTSKTEPPDQQQELAGQVRLACDLAGRAQPIAQRQVLNHVRVFLGVPPWLADVATRYQQRGWVAWHQLQELLNLEAAFERQAGPWRAAAAAVGAEISRDTLLKPGLDGRRGLLAALQKGLASLDFPQSFEDKALTRVVLGAWPGLAQVGPMAGLRGPLLQVRALDPQWQPLLGEPGQPSRQQRDFAASFASTSGERPFAGCWILWGTVERRGTSVTVRLADDLRQVRCPGSPPEQSRPAVTQVLP